MGELRRRLMTSVKNNEDMSIYDAMNEHMYVIMPDNNPYMSSRAVLYNLEYGKTYRIIFKVARDIPTNRYIFFAYKLQDNEPNVPIAIIQSGETILETTYTHEQTDTYTRIGVWVTDSSERNFSHPIIMYIEEL